MGASSSFQSLKLAGDQDWQMVWYKTIDAVRHQLDLTHPATRELVLGARQKQLHLAT